MKAEVTNHANELMTHQQRWLHWEWGQHPGAPIALGTAMAAGYRPYG